MIDVKHVVSYYNLDNNSELMKYSILPPEPEATWVFSNVDKARAFVDYFEERAAKTNPEWNKNMRILLETLPVENDDSDSYEQIFDKFLKDVKPNWIENKAESPDWSETLADEPF